MDIHFLSAHPADMSNSPKHRCANIKNKKHPMMRCTYPIKRGDFCSRHYKNPVRFEISSPAASTRSTHMSAVKIQHWWTFWKGLLFAKRYSPLIFCRDQCHNDTELATFEPLSTIPTAYFFTIRQHTKYWGFDIRALLIQYEYSNTLQNPYTTELCEQSTLERFRKRLEDLRRWKLPLELDNGLATLNTKQSWNLRVLDVCLRLDVLGYRIATQWFSDMDITQHRKLYAILNNMWSESIGLTEQQKESIVPQYNVASQKLFRLSIANTFKSELDSIRRTNLNVIQRLISSANQQSDKTLGAMYVVMGLAGVSERCRIAYPWING